MYLIGENEGTHIPYHLTHPARLPTPLLFNGTTSSLQVLPKGKLLISKNSMTTSSEDFVISYPIKHEEDPDKTSSISIEQVSFYATKHLQKFTLSQPEDFWFKGAESKDVHGWILKPPGFVKGQESSHPLAFIVHGGPESSWADSWSTRWNLQIFAQEGYVVVAINVSYSLSS